MTGGDQVEGGQLCEKATLLLPPACRLWREVVNKACLWEADLPLRPPGLSAASSLPPPPHQKPPPAACPVTTEGTNGSTSQVKTCISCVFRANASLRVQKGRALWGRGRGGGAPGRSPGSEQPGERSARTERRLGPRLRGTGALARKGRGGRLQLRRLPRDRPGDSPETPAEAELCARGGRLAGRGCPKARLPLSQGGDAREAGPQPCAQEGWKAAAGKGS